MKEYLERIFLKKDGKLNNNYKKIISKLDANLYEYISNQYTEYEDIGDRLKSILSGQYKRCTVCNTIISWQLKKTCSSKCAKEGFIENTKKTNLERYGSESHLSNKDVRSKIKKTNLERYGYENPLHDREVKEQIKKTNIERYGYENPSRNPDVKEKIKKTNLERYGYENPLHNPDIQEKIKETNLKRYGSEHAAASDQIRQKIKDTNIERYGSEHTFIDKFVKIGADTNIKKYGNRIASKSDIVKYKIKNTKRVNKQSILKEKGVELKDGIPFDVNRNYTDAYMDCLINGVTPPISVIRDEFSSRSHQVIMMRHFGYNVDVEFRSTYEQDLQEFVKSLVDESDIQFNTRSVINPFELDVYIPKFKLAIEFNGDFWHSSSKVGSQYHQNKTKMCNELGITLIHIFQYKYIKKRGVYHNIIRSKLGLNANRVYARKCKIVKLSKDQEREFLNSNHLQGFVNSTVCYGLDYNNEILSVCSFGKSRFDKKYEWELIRNCTVGDTTVVGGLSKLINQFKQEYNAQSIICYSDASISFKKGDILTKPNYVWVKGNKVYTRYQTMKQNLPKLLDHFIAEETEVENLIRHNFCQIHDSGNYKNVL